MANCAKCDNGMITEISGPDVFKMRCGCKSLAYWERRRHESKARRELILREYENKVGV